MPGDFYFGDHTTCIKTLLGSCVAIVMWHPQKRIGGMCHYMLPGRSERTELSARYADEAMQMFLRKMALYQTRPQEYQAKVFGGADMFSNLPSRCPDAGDTFAKVCSGCQSVACRNRHTAKALLQQHGFTIVESDLGGTKHRQVEFHIGSGKTRVTRNSATPPVPPMQVQGY